MMSLADARIKVGGAPSGVRKFRQACAAHPIVVAKGYWAAESFRWDGCCKTVSAHDTFFSCRLRGRGASRSSDVGFPSLLSLRSRNGCDSGETGAIERRPFGAGFSVAPPCRRTR
jgi:hypothetical protein